MKVTGWTWYENPKYIDILEEYRKIRTDAINNLEPKMPPIPNKHTREELIAIFNERDKKMKELADTDEFKEMARLESDIEFAVFTDIKANGYHFTGEEHQNCEYGCPIIDEKYIYCVSERSWGGLIARAFPFEIDDLKNMAYVVWAWDGDERQKGKHKIPDKSLWRE